MEEIQAAYKLSQNRNETDYDHIIDELQHEGNPNLNQMSRLLEEKRKS